MDDVRANAIATELGQHIVILSSRCAQYSAELAVMTQRVEELTKECDLLKSKNAATLKAVD